MEPTFFVPLFFKRSHCRSFERKRGNLLVMELFLESKQIIYNVPGIYILCFYTVLHFLQL